LLSKNIKIKIHRTINLAVVLTGYENWLLTLREERRPKMFENRVVRRIFGPKRNEVKGEWRQLHNELNDLSSSPKEVYTGVLSGKLEGKGPLGRPRQKWKDKIKWIFRNWDGQAWTGLIWFKRGTGSGPLSMQ